MYRSLDADRIVDSLELLARRIGERFPASGLSGVAGELLDVARTARERAAGFERPMFALRSVTLAGVALILSSVGYSLWKSRTDEGAYSMSRTLELFDAGANVVFLVGGAALFLVTFERRVRRARVLKALHELRSLAHVIDMHQLTKDPSRVIAPQPTWSESAPRASMTPAELFGYLDYCSELLAHLGKLGALYVQGFEDSVAVAAANDIEDLTNGLARKIWQKIMVLQADERAAGA